MIDGVNTLWKEDKELQKKYFGDFPFIASQHSLVAKHVTKDKWDQLKNIATKTSGFTLAKAIACAVTFNNQHCGIYAGDWDSYKDFAPVFDPLIQEYHGISPSAKHSSDMDVGKIKGNIAEDVPVHSCRIRVGRSIDGFGLSPGITKEQRLGVEGLMKNAVKNFPADLAGQYYPLTGMQENIRQQLVDDHFLFVSGDRNLTVAGMERDWPRVVVSSTMTRRPSLSGSTRRISSASSPWKMEAMSRESLKDFATVSRWFKNLSRKNLERTSALTKSMVMCTHAQPILVLV